MIPIDAIFNDGLKVRFDTIRGKFKGERCWCIGNGPSLAATPLELLEGEYTFGLNKIADIYPSTTWRPSFYVNVGGALSESNDCLRAAKEAMEYSPSFLCADYLPELLKEDPRKRLVYLLPRDVYPLRVTCRKEQTISDVSVWSNDIFERVSKDGSSMLAVMQIAAYMGFDTFVLVGCDMGWKAFDWE